MEMLYYEAYVEEIKLIIIIKYNHNKLHEWFAGDALSILIRIVKCYFS
jgi:hypothetical protein